MPTRSLKKYEKELEKISKNLDKIKKYRETKASLNIWKNQKPSLPNPFVIVRDFIKEKIFVSFFLGDFPSKHICVVWFECSVYGFVPMCFPITSM